MTTDRSALEEAIRELSNIWSKGSMVLPSGFDCTMSPAFCRRLKLVCDAASAHAETMPRTKMVEVWHVHYSRLQGEGYWAALVEGGFMHETGARREALRLANDTKNACVTVTGPHQQEIPA